MFKNNQDGLTAIEWAICKTNNEKIIMKLFDNDKSEQTTIIQRIIKQPWLFVCLARHNVPYLFNLILKQLTQNNNNNNNNNNIINYKIKGNENIICQKNKDYWEVINITDCVIVLVCIVLDCMHCGLHGVCLHIVCLPSVCLLA